MRIKQLMTESRRLTDPYEIVVDLYDKSFPYIKEYLKNFRAAPNDGMMYSGRNGDNAYHINKIRTGRYPKDTPEHIHGWFDDLFLEIFGTRYRSNAVFVTGGLSTADRYGDNIYGIFPIGNNYRYIYSPYISDLYSEMIDSGQYPYMGMDIQDIAGEMMDDSDSFDGDDIWEESRDMAAREFAVEHNREDYEIEDEDGDMVFDEDGWADAEQEYVNDNSASFMERLSMDKAEDISDEMTKTINYEIGRYKEDDLKGAINSKNEIMLSGGSYAMVRDDYLPFVMRYMEVNKSRKPTPERWDEAMRNFDPKRYSNLVGVNRMKKTIDRYINKESKGYLK